MVWNFKKTTNSGGDVDKYDVNRQVRKRRVSSTATGILLFSTLSLVYCKSIPELTLKTNYINSYKGLTDKRLATEDEAFMFLRPKKMFD